jgi:hypothetical protein
MSRNGLSNGWALAVPGFFFAHPPHFEGAVMAEAKKETEVQAADQPVRYKLGEKVRTVSSPEDKIRLEFDGWQRVNK